MSTATLAADAFCPPTLEGRHQSNVLGVSNVSANQGIYTHLSGTDTDIDKKYQYVSFCADGADCYVAITSNSSGAVTDSTGVLIKDGTTQSFWCGPSVGEYVAAICATGSTANLIYWVSSPEQRSQP